MGFYAKMKYQSCEKYLYFNLGHSTVIERNKIVYIHRSVQHISSMDYITHKYPEFGNRKKEMTVHVTFNIYYVLELVNISWCIFLKWNI